MKVDLMAVLGVVLSIVLGIQYDIPWYWIVALVTTHVLFFRVGLDSY